MRISLDVKLITLVGADKALLGAKIVLQVTH